MILRSRAYFLFFNEEFKMKSFLFPFFSLPSIAYLCS